MRIPNPIECLGLMAGHIGMGRAPAAPLVAGGAQARGVLAGHAAGRGAGASRAGTFAGLLHARDARDAGDAGEGARGAGKAKRRAPEEEDEALDPLYQSLSPSAVWAPPLAGAMAVPSAPAAAVERQARTSLEELLPALVRKIAWSGDARRGTVRLELGAGALSGATLVVHADEGRVRVQLNAPEGVDPAAWRARIEERLAARGLDVESVEVQ